MNTQKHHILIRSSSIPFRRSIHCLGTIRRSDRQSLPEAKRQAGKGHQMKTSLSTLSSALHGLIFYPNSGIIEKLFTVKSKVFPKHMLAISYGSPALIRIQCALIMKFSLSFEVFGSNLFGNRRLRMKPTFDQVLRLLVCVAGIVFFEVSEFGWLERVFLQKASLIFNSVKF